MASQQNVSAFGKANKVHSFEQSAKMNFLYVVYKLILRTLTLNFRC